jgi:hypothetical protein
MNYCQRFQELESEFVLGKNIKINKQNTSIQFFPFISNSTTGNDCVSDYTILDDKINENGMFEYPVFVNSRNNKYNKAILLVHGLNERNWSKYLTWAEYLCVNTGKPVILFPIAFHINRSPQSWTNPRILKSIIDIRRSRNGEDRYLSFANVALSERITENPRRFYSSGRQSLNDITSLLTEIKSGNHPLFTENTEVDVFAYSIGAFLSQIAFISNPKNLFSNSKLFMFCGGSIFNRMFGQSRSIMDKIAYERLLDYYQNNFSDESELPEFRDNVFEAFQSMISIERKTEERLNFFSKMGKRLSGLSLSQDKVIPYQGILDALGSINTENTIKRYDFPFLYTHENPFPVCITNDSHIVNQSFKLVFDNAVEHLA